jgi:hypothetical protein
VDVADFYLVTLPANGRLDMTLTTDSTLRARIRLYNTDGLSLTSSGYTLSGGSTVNLSRDCMAAGNVYLHVDFLSGAGPYVLDANLVQPAEANDAEPNNSLSEAVPLASNTAQGGHLGYFNTPIPTDNGDYYVYAPQDTGLLNIRVILTNTLQGRLLVYNNAGSLQTSSGFVTADTINLAYHAPSGDTLRFQVSRNTGCGGYTIEVDNGCPQPTNVTEQLIISIGVQLDWDDMPLAVGGYNIGGRRAGIGNFLTGFGIPNSNFRRFPLQSCTEYEYRVESVCATRTSGYIPVQTFTTLCAPFCPALTGVNVSSITSNSATVSWANSIVNTGAQLQYTPLGGSTLTATAPMGQNFINLTGLMPGTTYDYDLRQSCFDSGVSPFVSGSFTTGTLREDGTLSTMLFPNPATDRLVVQGLDELTTAEVINAQGQVQLQSQLQAGTDALNVSSLAPGHYILRLTGETQTQTMRFAVVR